MISEQLNSGKIADYIPLGQDGQPIYSNAEAFIAALRLNPMVGENMVRHLAHPRLSADGLNLDWYIPFPPYSKDGSYRVITWAAATQSERTQALQQLHELQRRLKRLGADLTRRSSSGYNQLFAHYLTGQSSVQNLPAIHFPNPDCVYIVDGIPVITFWGFVEKDHAQQYDPLESLKTAPQAPSFSSGAQQSFQSPQAPFAQQTQQAVPPERSGHKCFLPPWLLAILGSLLLALLLWLLFASGLLGRLFGWGPDLAFDGPDMTVDAKSEPTQPDLPPSVDLPKETQEPLADPKGDVATQDVLVVDLPNQDANVTVASGNAEAVAPVANLANDSGTGDMAVVIPSADMGVDASTGAVGSADVPAESAMAGESGMASETPAEQAHSAGAGSSEQATGANDGATDSASAAPSEQAANEGATDSSAAEQAPSSLPPVDLPTNTQEQAAATSSPAYESGMQANNQSGAAVPSLPPSLSYTPEQLKQEGVKVLNGAWNTRSGLMDSANGKPLRVGYQIQDGKGQLIVTRVDNVKCTADVSVATQGDNLTISPNGRAKCPDGNTYQVPQVQCITDSSGRTKCTGDISGQHFPVRFYENQ